MRKSSFLYQIQIDWQYKYFLHLYFIFALGLNLLKFWNIETKGKKLNIIYVLNLHHVNLSKKGIVMTTRIGTTVSHTNFFISL